jgi:hypothetical protein
METKNKNYDLRELLKPYANKWVALSNDRRTVIADGDGINDVMEKVNGKDVILFKVLPDDVTFVPANTN